MAPIIIAVLGLTNAATFTMPMATAAVAQWKPLLGSSLCAFALNLIIAVILKQGGAMAFILSGLVKDIVIVVSSSFIYDVPLTNQEIAGFILSLLGMGYWGLMKTIPTHPLIRWLPALLHGCEETKAMENERKPILATGKV